MAGKPREAECGVIKWPTSTLYISSAEAGLYNAVADLRRPDVEGIIYVRKYSVNLNFYSVLMSLLLDSCTLGRRVRKVAARIVVSMRTHSHV